MEEENSGFVSVSSESGRLATLTSPVENDEFSLDDAIECIGFGFYQVRLISIVGLSWMADAMEMMVLSILAPILLCEWNLQKYEEAMITTVVFIGLGFGSIFWGFIGDRYGRAKSLFVSVTIVFLFGLGSSLSPNYTGILTMRFLVGFGIGGVPQSVTIATELLPEKSRGKSIVFLEFFWGLGAVFAAAIAIPSVHLLGWRWYLVLITTPILLFLVGGILWLPESPRYLLTSGRYSDAVKLLEKIATCNKKPLPVGQLMKVKQNTNQGKVSKLFMVKWRRTTTLLLFIWLTSAFTYYGVVLLTTEVFQTNINGCNPHIINATGNSSSCIKLTSKDYLDFMWTSLAEFPGLFVTMLFIERLGRRKTLMLLFSFSVAAFLFLCICLSRSFTVVILFTLRGLVTGSFQTVYVYTPEVLPTNVRAIGLGLCSTFARLGAMATPFVAQVLIHYSFYAVIGVYSSLLFFCILASYLLPIETKGKLLANST